MDGFNPRPHAEGDSVQCYVFFNIRVSIHALTRRATYTRFPFSSFLNGFNPRPHAEGDWRWRKLVIIQREFQSTPSRGGRRLQT